MLNNNRQPIKFLDVLSILAFYIGWLNYIENINQSQMQDAINVAVNNIHEHLKNQDEKLDLVIKEIEKEGEK